MKTPKRYILIGFMGAGKTFLGKQLSEKLNIPFIDSDEEIEKKHNSTISEIFKNEGEEAFRLKEKKFIEALNPSESFVLATGGGLPCYSRNMDLINKLGKTIYLKASPTCLAARLLNNNTNRPLIENNQLEELKQFIKEKLAVREQFYNDASIIIEQEDLKLEDLLKVIEND